MHAPIGHIAACVVTAPAEVVVYPRRVVDRLGRRTEPGIIVERCRDLPGRRGPFFYLVCPHPVLYGVYLADRSAANQAHDMPNVFRRAMVDTHLDHAVVFAGSPDSPAALGDVVGERLLAIDMLAGPAGSDRNRRVPMVGGRDNDSIQRLVVHQPPVVGCQLGFAPRSLPGPGKMPLVHITESGDLHLGIPPGHPEQAASPASNADVTDRQALGRARGEHTWNERRQGDERRRARQETASRQVSMA